MTARLTTDRLVDWSTTVVVTRVIMAPMQHGVTLFLGASILLGAALGAQTPTGTDRFATVNGLRLHYLEWGDAGKPPMILLHGIARHAHTFDHIAPDLARSYRVLAIDMRGHGDSAWSPEGAYLVEDYV